MGLFDWIFGQPRFLTCLPDRVWMSRADMWRQLPAVLSDNAGQDELTIVAAHFQKTLIELRDILRDRAVFQEVTQPGEWLTAIKPTPACRAPVVLVPAELLHRIGLPVLPSGLNAVRIFVCTRHFLREKDDAIESFGERFAQRGQIGFHVSLDDPLLKIFVTETVKKFLQNSARGTPWLESGMVSNSIRKAQARIQARMISQQNADSPEEWLAKNVQQ